MSVFVSGANGFIALHIVSDLLKLGYKVIGSVRSQEKADQLHRQFKNPNLSVVIVENISNPGAFDELFLKYGKDIKVVLHTASPFHYNTENCERDLLNPAVNGTRNILESIKRYAFDSVERVVITSSDAAVTSFKDDTNPNNLLTEDSWNKISWEEATRGPEEAYYGAKTFAERAAHDFWKENQDKVKFKLSTVNPVWVFGPQLFDENALGEVNTSCQYIKAIIDSKMGEKLDMDIVGGYVDVRDVSKAHMVAFQKEESIGRRLVLCAGRFTLLNIADVLCESFPQLAGKIASGNPDESFKRLNSLAKFDYTNTNKILDFDFIPFEKTICDTAAQMLKMEKRQL
ncbi:hypothetical protein HG535_0C00290 [Zygotorulaspora mrakii]|uniref:NAD-dependent epimerase/dehydratase domain-containing protein n=1 Tax=Zygotorulaspora mrakii TaxID=42260 RepID=A0A7H9AZC5_ZYGMR|nr:uncharacterized protein HG535_0C00290 [Zygotorulaspora mrakii]QLG71681.1 hypothetical protein HG535_0C00290 [Zygotorulaspora mrakii]